MATSKLRDAAAPPQPAPAANGDGAAPAAYVEPWVAILRQYWPQLRNALPPQVNAEKWRGAVWGAMYRGQDSTKDIDLWRCANRNPESLLFELFKAARLGHEPGTDRFYLTPRPNSKAKQGVEVLGMEGYKGVIDRMYRAGVLSVEVAVVRQKDEYRYHEDVDRIPYHRYDKFARAAERGDIRGAYAYAILPGGVRSKVAEITQDDIDRAKESSGSARSNKPQFWNHWHDHIAMVLKTAVHKLEPWVPTATEDRQYLIALAQANATAIAQVNAARAVETGAAPGMGEAIVAAQGGSGARALAGAEPVPAAAAGDDPPFNPEQFAQPAAPEDTADDAEVARKSGATPGMVVDAPEPEPPAGGWVTTFAPPEGASGDDPPVSRGITTTIGRMLGAEKIGDVERRALAGRLAGRRTPIASTGELTAREGKQVVMTLTRWKDAGTLAPQLAAVLAAIAADTTTPAPAGDGAGEPPAVELPSPGTVEWHNAQHPALVDGNVVGVPVLLNGECGICEQEDAEA